MTSQTYTHSIWAHMRDLGSLIGLFILSYSLLTITTTVKVFNVIVVLYIELVAEIVNQKLKHIYIKHYEDKITTLI